MNENIVELTHVIEDNQVVGKHQPSGGVKFGVHIQEWFGDRFIAGIQNEDGDFILDQLGKIIFEE